MPLARLVWLDDPLTQAANDAPALSRADTEKLQQLQAQAIAHIGELGGVNSLPTAANDEPPSHSTHQLYWYQNDHLGTPRELTDQQGDIAWDEQNEVALRCSARSGLGQYRERGMASDRPTAQSDSA
ncbi:RHS domain-containing protein [Acinetobacter larvae]|uniref:RHS protein conserved region domain-containing protein n=1 Tax=Acinetobacter larvae TaxID=1789224 RepID=A0A1B2M2Q8_9GAMM|nr:RHS domain-containing protein [Acinetobacter larvae]AOA59472.1 hypothetical protein BFG52_14705 [Acinetobacter larvae]